MRKMINNSKQTVTILVVALAMFSLLGGSAVAGHLITGKNVKNSTLTGADLKNGSVGPSDLNSAAKAALTGPTGPQGAPGTHGPIATVYNGSLRSTDGNLYSEFSGNTANITVPEGASKLLITFSGECSVRHDTDQTTQEIRFKVDGVVIEDPIRFCRNDEDNPTENRREAASMQMPAAVTPGDHTVTIEHRTTTADGTAWLNNTTLSVITG